MTEEAATRILSRLERILEAADEIHPMDIANHIKDDTLWGWTKALRDRIYERVGEIESEVQKCEGVVRCRDCRFYTPESMTREERGFGVYENVWEPGGCFNPERCSATWDSIAGQMVSVGIVTEPDGFCAWGERREA